MMINSSSLNHAKVLLHLKWFINRLVKSFEHKIQNSAAIECCPSLDRQALVSMNGSRATSRSMNSPGGSPLSVFRGQLKNRSISTDGDQIMLNIRTPDYDCKKTHRNHLYTGISSQNRSPKVRSLTNSPFLMRLSLSRILPSKRSPLSEYSDSNSDLEGGIHSDFQRSNFSGYSSDSLCKNGISGPSVSPLQNVEQLRTLLILRNTTESERRRSISRFAQHICIVYEYQIGFLQGLKAVHTTADYVADLLVRSIQIGRVTSLSASDLSLRLLYEADCRPTDHLKCVKTSPMTGTGEQLSWRLSEMWIRPGLRHNEVGGENCHNLNIVTHFLAPCSDELELKRPDIYGYRNLIVLPSSDSLKFSSKAVYENGTLNDATVYANEINGLGNGTDFYDIFTPDEDTINVSNVRSGSRMRSPMSKVQKMEALTTSSIRRSDVVKRQQAAKTKPSLLSTSVNLRQHLHRAYRPVFFVIYERPSVIDHLSECESFAAFCKRQNICPVMFLNQETDFFEGRVCTSLFQHFDIFCLTTNGYMPRALSDGSSDRPVNERAPRVTDRGGQERNRLRRSNDVCLGGIDNPGFIS